MKILQKCLWLLLFYGHFAVLEPARAQTIVVDGSQTNQPIEGFGVNLNYQGWTNDDLKPVIDAFVDQANMTLFRVVFDNTDWEGTNDNDDSDVMDWDYYNSIYSSPRFQQLWGVIGYLNQKGITNGVILNFQGPGPDWMGGTALIPGYEDEWAEMIASLLYYARYTQHLQFTLVGPDNEIDYSPQGISADFDQYVTMLHDLAVKLDTNGMSDVRFVAPDLAFTDTNLMAALMDDPVIMAKLSHFGLHDYGLDGIGSTGIYDFVQQSPYPDITFWMTEYNVHCDVCEAGYYGNYDWSFCQGTAQNLFAHLGNGASAGIVWDGYDSVYYMNGTNWTFWGLFGVDDTNAVDKTYTPRKNFYTLSQISKFVLPGAYSIGVSGNDDPFAQLMAFWQPNTGQFTLTGINTDTDDGGDALSVSLTSLPPIASLELYYTDQNSNLIHLPTIIVTNGTEFTAVIPADCVFTLVGSSDFSATITNPADGAQFTAPATITIQALVLGTNGTIAGIDFFNGTSNIGTVTAPPYEIGWSNVPPGNYVLSVTASNSVGSIVASSGVNVTVVGPLAQILVLPTNATVPPFNTLQFSAIGSDALGTVFNPQPAFVWTAVGGTIHSNGLFTAGGTPGGPFAISASNGSITGSANVTVLDNLALAGTGYTWYGLINSSQNFPIVVAPGINDGDLATDVPLTLDGIQELSEAWEAAGVIWNTPQSIGHVTYVNGTYDNNNDGVFGASFGLQFSPDGSTWTNAGPEWSVTPAYSFDSAASGDMSFNFSGGFVTAEGVRCIGLVHSGEDDHSSWVAYATELQVYPPSNSPVLTAGLTSDGVVISWGSSLTNFILETTTDPGPPYSWSAVTNAPQSVGNLQQVILAPAFGQQLFRLHEQ